MDKEVTAITAGKQVEAMSSLSNVSPNVEKEAFFDSC